MAQETAAQAANRYSTRDVAVDGGTLHVGVWDPVDGAEEAPTVLAVHGVTAHHREFVWLAQALPQRRIVAPDLRGRGRSNELPGPYGMARHADDLAAVMEELGTGPVVVLGHSMGGFVSVVTADRHPELVRSLLLVDGGLPLPVPPGVSVDTVMEMTIGPILERISQTYPDQAAYVQQFKDNPGFIGHWDERTEAYAIYDTTGTEPRLRARTGLEAVRDDSRDLLAGEDLRKALAQLRHPTTFVYAPIGMGFDVPPLYPDAVLQPWRDQRPDIAIEQIDDVNHFTIVMSDPGAAALAAVLTGAAG